VASASGESQVRLMLSADDGDAGEMVERIGHRRPAVREIENDR
jgi:hypothetical protein